jgi:hypothetical protein
MVAAARRAPPLLAAPQTRALPGQTPEGVPGTFRGRQSCPTEEGPLRRTEGLQAAGGVASGGICMILDGVPRLGDGHRVVGRGVGEQGEVRERRRAGS